MVHVVPGRAEPSFGPRSGEPGPPMGGKKTRVGNMRSSGVDTLDLKL